MYESMGYPQNHVENKWIYKGCSLFPDHEYVTDKNCAVKCLSYSYRAILDKYMPQWHAETGLSQLE